MRKNVLVVELEENVIELGGTWTVVLVELCIIDVEEVVDTPVKSEKQAENQLRAQFKIH